MQQIIQTQAKAEQQRSQTLALGRTTVSAAAQNPAREPHLPPYHRCATSAPLRPRKQTDKLLGSSFQDLSLRFGPF